MLLARPPARSLLQTARLRTIRTQSTYQPPDPQPSRPNPHGNFYKVFGRPVIKNFLVAVVTYQVLYFSWSKLESMETKRVKESEIRSLEGELKELVGMNKSN